jgi:hypothetical protein
MALAAPTCDDSGVMIRPGARRTSLWLLLATMILPAIGCDAGLGSEPIVESDEAPSAVPVTTPAAASDIPNPRGPRDDVVFDRLVNDGFSTAEASCLAHSLTIDEMVSQSPEELIDVYASCLVGLDRLIELGAQPTG